MAIINFCYPKEYNTVNLVIAIPHVNYNYHVKKLYKWLKKNIFDEIYVKMTYLGYFGIVLDLQGKLYEKWLCNVLELQKKLFEYVIKNGYIIEEIEFF